MEEENRLREKEKLAERSIKESRRKEREERRRQQKLAAKKSVANLGSSGEEEIGEKIAIEERKLLVAQRKLESIRMLDELLERVKVCFFSKKTKAFFYSFFSGG